MTQTKAVIVVFTMLYMYVQGQLYESIRGGHHDVFRIRTVTLHDRNGWPRLGGIHGNVHLDVLCREPHFPMILPKGKTLTGLYFHNCKIPNDPLAELLKNHKDTFVGLETLRFTDTLMSAPLRSDYGAGLPIRTLELFNAKNFHVTSDFFQSFTNLKELHFILTEVPPLPSSESMPLEKLIVSYSPVKNWDNCKNLTELSISGVHKTQVPEVWPEKCTKLKTLQLEALTPETVHYLTNTFKETSLVNLEKLVVKNCSLVNFPLELLASKKILHLDLSDNELEVDVIAQMPMLINLQILNLSNNRRLVANVVKLLPKSPDIRELDISSTNVYGSITQLKQVLPKLKSVQKLWIDNTLMSSRTDFMHIHFTNLSYLSWATGMKSPILNLQLHGFPSTEALQLEINLKRVTAIHVTLAPEFVKNQSDYESRTRDWLVKKGYKLIVKLDSVDCDCKNEVLAKALKQYPHFLAMPDLKCSHGGLFKDEPMENFSCRTATQNGCKRKIYYKTLSTTVDCSYNSKFRWPRPRNFRGLNATGNGIKSLDKAYLPDSLEWLDLSHNSISKLSSEQSAQLFGNKGRRVRLSGNPIICDCDNQPLLDALHVNQSLVEDYDRITCAGSDKPLSLVSVAELCRPRSVMVSASLGALAVLALLAALLVRHYWNTIRMLLFARGLCLSCFSEEDLDHDRPYDAFLSFAHGDDEYAMDQLMAQLEGKPNFFRLCVHYRDWVIGKWIPAQVMQSVRLSKRTIIVLSKNFVKSCWGMLEFRHAHAEALAGGRQRLLIIILDDVLSEPLPSELQAYLEFNTYLKHDDPWFWEKLLYAMPHKINQGNQQKRLFGSNGQNRPQLENFSALDMNVLSMDIESV